MKKSLFAGARSERIRAEAGEWFLAFCEGELDGSGREAFDRWLKESPEHLRAYLRISAVWENADLLKDRLPLTAGAGRPRRWALTRTRLAALAACLALACTALAGISWWWSSQYDSYRTLAGERRTVQLTDGSTVQLNARSAIKVRFSNKERGITLTEGQALFSVIKDAQRPFVVRVGDSQFKAVGTQFDVYRKPSQAVLTVVEGRVAVDNRAQPSLLVSAGEQAKIGPGNPRVAYPINAASATSWTEGTLTFAATALADAVQEYNRTGLRRVIIADANLLKYHISGAFPAADPEPMIRFLQQRFGVIVKESVGDIRIYPPSKE